jgi:hypothetical protein
MSNEGKSFVEVLTKASKERVRIIKESIDCAINAKEVM